MPAAALCRPNPLLLQAAERAEQAARGSSAEQGAASPNGNVCTHLGRHASDAFRGWLSRALVKELLGMG